jgi:hypothetical protein
VSLPPESSRQRKSIIDLVSEEVSRLPPETDESQALAELERTRLELDRQRILNDQVREGINDSRADRDLRRRYANYAFRFLLGFSIFCGLVLVAQGSPDCPFKLGDPVVIALISSTAVSVVGLVGWVARGLFKAPGA